MRGAAGHLHGDDVAGAGTAFVRGEVDQAVVAGTAGQAVGRGVLPALAFGDQDLDDGAGLLLVLRVDDLVGFGGQALVALLDYLLRDLVWHRRGGGAGADRVAEGERAREPRLAHQVQGVLEVLVRLPREADDDVGGDRGVRYPGPDVGQDGQVAVAPVGAAHRLQHRVGTGLQRHVQAGHHVRGFRHRVDDVLGEVPRVW